MQYELASTRSEFTTANLIFSLIESSLGNVPFHNDTTAVARYVADRFPVHLAIHKISGITDTPPVYTQSHVHPDEDEINIILSETELIYLIDLAGEEHVVGTNNCIYIPRGMQHAANVLHGSGYFITLRFP